jgi:hypothetical protein
MKNLMMYDIRNLMVYDMKKEKIFTAIVMAWSLAVFLGLVVSIFKYSDFHFYWG